MSSSDPVRVTVEFPYLPRAEYEIEVLASDEEDFARGVIDFFVHDTEKQIKSRRRVKQYYEEHNGPEAPTGTES